MTNVNVKVVGTANLAQMSGPFGKLEAQVAALNAQLAKMVTLNNGVDPKGFDKMSRAMAANDRIFRSAVASTGMFEQQQLRLNKATDTYIEKMQKQKLTFRDMMRDRKTASLAYREQLAMENMSIRSTGQTRNGKQIIDTSVPNQVSKQMDTAGKRLAFFNEQLKSGAHQMVNWGKNTQWSGRQLMVGFTMPILAAGAAAGVLAYQLDKEFTRIAKVYDTTADATSTSMNDMMAVEKELMSLREAGTETAIKAAREYGAAAKDTLQVQAELAATGQTGIELQKSTAEVMRIARLGEVDHQTAIESTIALQSIFKMNTEQLTEAFDYMNSVENATSLATADFAKAIPIAAAPVKAFGGDIKELGILLTAMKEEGIGAAEGANAIKATMQRLSRPSKQIRQEFEALTGQNITEIVEGSESLTEIFTKLNEITAEMPLNKQRKVFAGLFGSYQVTRMMAMTKGMGKLEEGIGQVSDAYRISQGSAEDWAKTAEMEIERYTKSISGQFDTALQEVKIQMSTLGEPFVEIATKVIKGVSKIIDVFNSMPDFAKKFIGISVALAAIAGPIIMLTGLFANLAGSALKGVSFIISLAAKMKIATVSQRAAEMQANLAAKGFMTEKTAVEQLTASINKLTAAQAAANAPLVRRNPYQNISAYQASTPTTPTASRPKSGYAASGVGGGPLPPVNIERNRAAHAAEQRRLDSLREKERVRLAEQEAKARAKSARTMRIYAASGAVATASMLTMMTTTNETANNIAKWAMVGSVVVPAVMALVPPMTKAVLLAKTYAREKWSAAAAAASDAATTARNAGKGRVGAFLAGGGALAPRLLNPITLTVAAIGAGLAGVYYWQKKTAEKAEEIRKEQERQINNQVSLMNTTENWAKASGKVLKNYRDVAKFSSIEMNRPKEFETKKEFYTTGEGLADAEAFNALKTDAERANVLTLQFIESTEKLGESASEARAGMMALAVAGGKSLFDANKMVNDVFESLGGEAGVVDFAKFLNDRVRLLTDSVLDGADLKIVSENGKIVAEVWHAAMVDASESEKGQLGASLMNTLESVSQGAYGNISKIMGSLSDENMKMFAENFNKESLDMISSYENFKAAMEDDKGLTEFIADLEQMISAMPAGEERSRLEGFARDLLGAMTSAQEGVTGVTKSFLEQLRTMGLIGSEVTTLRQAMKEPLVLQLMSDEAITGEIILALRQIIDLRNHINAVGLDSPFGSLLGGAMDNQEQALLDMVNAVNEAKGYQTSDVLETALNNWRYQIKVVEKDVEKVTKKKRSLSIDVEANFKQFRMDAMKNIQDEIANMITEGFEESQSNAMDARQAYWDRQQEAQDKAFERQQEGLDAKWDKRRDKATAYWDSRVKMVETAIEAEQKAEDRRQKMFDAEMARIQRLNEAMNRNIDFNVALNEGNFDEAAKIRNDSFAEQSSTFLERAAGAGSKGSDKRIEKLEDRLDRIDDRRDNYMKRLDEQEDAEQKHLKKIQDMHKKSMDERVRSDIKALEKMQKAEGKRLEANLRMFQAYLPRNKKELGNHMKDMLGAYTKFGGETLEPLSDKWGKFYGRSTRRSMRESALAMQSDAVWEEVGNKAGKHILRGMGFANIKQFERFVLTGKMPKGGLAASKKRINDSAQHAAHVKGRFGETRHEGGEIGTGGGSRKGVARTTKGLHQSEVMVRAQKGEYMVNRKDAAANKGVLDAINSGKYGTDVGGVGEGVNGLVGALASRAYIAGIQRGFENVKNNVIADSLSSSVYGAGKVGIYGDRIFNAEQLKNAATIASVGSSMGMSTRDIMIGIMTAITESGLINVNYGDRDSLGLFQQRPSQGWGSPEQVTNPNYAARKFFEGLQGLKGRDKMPPWLAAQSVQRSFDETGSNYRQYWDEAQEILKTGLSRTKKGSYTPGGFIQGAGGKARPVRGGVITQGLHYKNAIDFGVPRGTPVFAAADGKIVSSRDIAGPLPTDRYRGDGPYGSYGRVIEINHGGFSTLYAHLAQRYARTGQNVKGGAKIGLSGNTGNSSGPHLHFGAPGSNPYAFLKTGGTIKSDNTPAILHKDERVLTAPLTKKLDVAVDSLYRAAKYGVGGKGGSPYGKFNYPGVSPTSTTSSPFFEYDPSNPIGAKGASGDSGRKASLKIGTLNTWVKSSVNATISDLKRLTQNADFLALTEMQRKAGPIKKWLNKNNWGAVAPGTGHRAASMMAYNKATQILNKSGQRKLGDKMANVVGGRSKRYANYGQFTDKKSGRKTWQVAAHTVPAGRGLNAKNAPLYHEQWGNLNKLVNQLQASGQPVFVSGDLNVHKGRSNFQTPGRLNEFASMGVDYVFGDKKLSKLNSSRYIRGMHTDHNKRALMANFSIPQLSKGAENVRWDNTIANLHRGESVLTADISDKFRRGVDNFANGSESNYTVQVNVTSPNATADEIADKAITKLKRMEARKPSGRRAS